MTNVQSKLRSTVNCSCRSYQHPWTHSCKKASLGLLLASIPFSLRVYTTLYTVVLLLRQRLPNLAELRATITGILRSSAFLVTNTSTFTAYNCLLRELFGHYYWATAAFLPCLLASLTGILIEQPSRRSARALYVANVATETLWNMAEARGIVRSIPQGQTLIFGVSASILLYLYRLGLHKTTCKDSLFKVLRIFVGKEEKGPLQAPVESMAGIENVAPLRQPLKLRNLLGLVQIYGRFIDTLKSRHESCPHKAVCVNYALMGGLKPFVGSVTLQVALKLLMNIPKIVQFKMQWRKTIFQRSMLNLGVFLGSFSFLYKAVSCTLRHSFGRDDPRFAIPAGLIGSVAFTQYPDVTVALYVMWKALQIAYNLGIEKRVVPQVPGFSILLHIFSSAVLFHVGILQPQYLRPSYSKFLDAVSGQRFSKFNVEPFDAFGLNSSQHARELMTRLNMVNPGKLPTFALAT